MADRRLAYVLPQRSARNLPLVQQSGAVEFILVQMREPCGQRVISLREALGKERVDALAELGRHFARRRDLLANFAESRGSHFGRIEAVARVGDAFRSLDFTKADARETIRLGPSAKALFEGATAKLYPNSDT